MADSRKRLTEVITLRLAPADRDALDAVARTIPDVPTLTIARIALRLGLRRLAEDPKRIVGQPDEKRGGARRRKKDGS